MSATKILLIRHAEKPDDRTLGVLPGGSEDEKSLTVRGWQRAGALACLLASSGSVLESTLLATPKFIFASHSSSQRPQQTVEPLAEKLGIVVNLDHGKGDEEKLAIAVKACDGGVLISWQHEYMSAVANAVLGDEHTAPQEWPKDRFDMVWVFDFEPVTSSYRFSQASQHVLAGDSLSPI